MDLGEPPEFPSIVLPSAIELPRAVLEVPRVELPYYKPLVVPPSDLRPPLVLNGNHKMNHLRKHKTKQNQLLQSNQRLKYLSFPHNLL